MSDIEVDITVHFTHTYTKDDRIEELDEAIRLACTVLRKELLDLEYSFGVNITDVQARRVET